MEEQTNNRIKDLVDPENLDVDTRALLVNAIYFKVSEFIIINLLMSTSKSVEQMACIKKGNRQTEISHLKYENG